MGRIKVPRNMNILANNTINIAIYIRVMAFLDTPKKVWNIQRREQPTQVERSLTIYPPIDRLESLPQQKNSSKTEDQVLTPILARKTEDTDIVHLAKKGEVTDIGHLAKKGEVTDIGHLAKKGEVTDIGHLAKKGEVTDTGHLAKKGEVTDTGHLAKKGEVTDTGYMAEVLQMIRHFFRTKMKAYAL
jgi:hypothetical protein